MRFFSFGFWYKNPGENSRSLMIEEEVGEIPFWERISRCFDNRMTATNNGTVTHACTREIYAYSFSFSFPRRAHASSPPSRQSVDGMLHMHAPIDMNASLHTKRPGRYLIPDFPFGCERSPLRGASPRVFRAETLPANL